MPPVFMDNGTLVRHPLEEALNAEAWVMLNAIARQRMSVMNLKGQLAESYLNEHLYELKQAGVIQDYAWRLVSPDFAIRWRDRDFQLECKNVRSQEKGKHANSWRVEVQRTRAGKKKGKDTRPYRLTDFDLLAVCMFNRTGSWSQFRFISCRKMKRRQADETLLEVFHQIPELAGEPWHDDLTLALADAMAAE